MTDNQIQSAVIRFAGDSGDGMQLTGGQFTLTTALSQQELTTFPDFPSEIRAPKAQLMGFRLFRSILVPVASIPLVMSWMCWYA